MQKTRNLLPKLCLTLLAFVLVAVILAVGSSWLLSWNVPGDLLFDQNIVQSLVLGVIPVMAVAMNIILATYRATDRRDWAWLVAFLLIWPLSFWYTLLETDGER